jgi:hypothetical protein
MGKVFKKILSFDPVLSMLTGAGDKEEKPKLQQQVQPAQPAEEKKQAAPVAAGATQDEIQAKVDEERRKRAALNKYEPEDGASIIGKPTVLGG